MTRNTVILLLLALCFAASLRLPRLGERPMHNDEAVNAIKFGQLWEHSRYVYDPNEHHGPTLYYSSLLLGWLTGAPGFDLYTEARLRLLTVLFGLGLLLLMPLLSDALGRTALSWAALFTAFSPALVFYSRYFIHEMLLVFFTLLAIAAGWRYWRTRKLVWIILAGAACGLMHATKETFVITLGAAVLALIFNQTWNRLIDASGLPIKAPPLKLWHLGIALAVWVIVAGLLFSSFLTNPGGLLDSIRTYLPWLQRAGGESPHIHPWYFYLHRLLFFQAANGPVWTEALLLILATLGTVAGFRRRLLAGANPSFVRFLAFYAFVLAGFYSFLPYKTPWCLLNFWHPVILLAGVGAAAVMESLRATAWKYAVVVLLLIGAGHLAWQSWQLNTEFAADTRNPYVYAQTSEDIMDLVKAVEGVASFSPERYQTTLQVVAPEDDYWPLPWYLRRFTHVGYWNKMPENPYAPIMILSPRLPFTYDENRVHLMGFYGLRPQVPLSLFVSQDLWKNWAAGHQPTR